MKPNGKEIAVYTVGSRVGYIAATLVSASLLVWLFPLCWMGQIDPEYRSGENWFGYVVTKFFGIPFLAIMVIAGLRTVSRKSMKTVWLRVGEQGVWHRNLMAGETFTPWSKIQSVRIKNVTGQFNSRVLKFQTESDNPLFSLALDESCSSLPLEQLAEKFCRFPAFAARYRTGDRGDSGQS